MCDFILIFLTSKIAEFHLTSFVEVQLYLLDYTFNNSQIMEIITLCQLPSDNNRYYFNIFSIIKSISDIKKYSYGI